MTDIFLSYTERDRDTARQIAEVLGSAGWSVWWDRRIPAGETWRSVLDQALAEMRCMVVLWSAKSIESEWVYEEASEGRRQGKLVPVMIENVRPPAGFREIQAADLTGWDGSPDFDGLRMLLSDLENLLGKPEVNAADNASSAVRRTARQPDANDDPDLPYGTSELPGYSAPATPVSKPRWPLWALAGGLLVAVAVAGIGLTSRQPAGPTTPAPESASRQAERSVPPAAVPAAPSPSTASVPPEVPRDSRPALETSTPALSHSKPKAEPVATIKHTDSTPQTSTRCANLLARIQLGETLSAASQSRFDKECRQ
ncbi:MAG: hypothetical protein H6R13_2311 [Proteobacteria bacterium]|nr:hypothetical protein [Pseudomonadota bacterium]